MTTIESERAETYAAFISHASADRRWAERVQRSLERFVVPKPLQKRETSAGVLGRRIGKVFRDRSDLAAATSLPDALERGLLDSRAILVICSPAAVASPWVNQEIATFKARKPGSPVLALIVSGEPGDPENECFPEALRYTVDQDGRISTQPSEPVAADARRDGDGWPEARLKLVAGLLGLDNLDELKRRELEAARARTRFAAAVAGLLGVLAIAASAASVLALRQTVEARARLTQAIDVAASRVDDAVDFQDRYGMPSAVVRELLESAASDFDSLFGDVAQDPELTLARANMLTAFTDHTLALGGDAERELDRLQEATDLLDRLARRVGERGSVIRRARERLANAAPRELDALLRPRLSDAAIAEARARLQRELGWVLFEIGDDKESTEAFSRAVALGDAMAEREQGESFWQLIAIDALMALSEARYYADDLNETREAALKALARIDDAADHVADSDLSALRFRALSQIAQAELELGEVVVALERQREAVNIARRRALADQTNTSAFIDLAAGHGRLGNMLVAAEDLGAARKEYAEAIKAHDALAGLDPDRADWRRELAIVLERDGNAAIQQSDQAAQNSPRRSSLINSAARNYERALEIRRVLAARDPSDVTLAREFSIALARMGDVARIRRRPDGAAAFYKEARGIRERLSKDHPENALLKRDVAVILMLHAPESYAASPSRQTADTGRADFKYACTVLDERRREEPEVPAFLRDAVDCWAKYGVFLTTVGDRDAARDALEAARERSDNLLSTFKGNALEAKWRRDRAWIESRIEELSVR